MFNFQFRLYACGKTCCFNIRLCPEGSITSRRLSVIEVRSHFEYAVFCCEILGSLGSEYEDDWLLGYCTI
jgi:hypothetical protein